MSDQPQYKIEDFWPGAESLLDKHFQQKKGFFRRSSTYILIGSALLVAGLLAIYFMPSGNQAQQAETVSNESVKTTEYSERSVSDNSPLNTSSDPKDKNERAGEHSISQKSSNDNTTKSAIASENRTENQSSVSPIKEVEKRNYKTAEMNKNRSALDAQQGGKYPAEKTSESSYFSSKITSGSSVSETIFEKNSAASNTESAINKSVSTAKTVGAKPDNSGTTANLESNSSEKSLNSIKNETSAQESIFEQNSNKLQEPVKENPNQSSGSEEFVKAELNSNQNSANPENLTEKNLESSTNTETEKSDVLDISKETVAQPESTLGVVIPEKTSAQSDKWKLSYAFNYGVFRVSKTLQSDAFAEYAARRSAEEKAAWFGSVQAGITLKKNRWGISTGIEMNQLGETVNYSNWLYGNEDQVNGNWLVTQDSLPQLNVYYLQGIEYNFTTYTYSSDSLQVFDTTQVYGKKVSDLKEFNSKTMFSYWEIPLQVGYTVYSNSKFSCGIQAGISLGILREKRGYYLNTSIEEPESLADSDAFKTLIWNGRVSTELNYWLSPKWALALTPAYRFNWSSVYKSAVPINQKYGALGVSIGIRAQF